jgi:hypothetical protein
MYFTREPLIETVMTPREGYKLVLRSTRNAETEEYFVDALEVVSFGQALFFRSMERPKCFLVPVSDYEVMEVRETRLILKAAPLEKGIKIGGGREAPVKSHKEVRDEKPEDDDIQTFEAVEEEEEVLEGEASNQESPLVESKLEKRRERRRHRRRKTKGDEKEEIVSEPKSIVAVDDISESYANGIAEDPLEDEKPLKQQVDLSLHFSSLIPPPPTLISETINQYRNNESFKKAFVNTDSDSIAHEAKEEVIRDLEPDFSGENAAHINHESDPVGQAYISSLNAAEEDFPIQEQFEADLFDKNDLKNSSNEQHKE